MKCPVCRIALRPADRDGAEVDWCPRCHGVWIGREQLDRILARPSPYDADWSDGAGFGRQGHGTERALAGIGAARDVDRARRPGFWSALFEV